MKNKIGMMVGMAALIPLAGIADIKINAMAQDGAIAYLYNGTEFGHTAFGADGTSPTGRSATIDNSTIPGPPWQQWGIAMQYKPGSAWYSSVAFGYDGVQEINNTTSFEAEAITGEVTTRSLSGTSASLTMTANGDLTTYNDGPSGTYQLNAQVGLYRSIKTIAEYNGVNKMSRSWSDSALTADYGYTTSVFDDGTAGLVTLTITNTAGTYISDFVGFDLGGGDFQLYFEETDFKDTFDSGTVTDDGMDVVFNVTGLGDGSFDDMTSYYVLMDAAYMEDAAGNYSEAYDAGMSLLNHDFYNIPEPSVMALLMGSGVVLLGVRRIFMI